MGNAYVSPFTWLFAIALSAATSSSLVITTRRWDTAGGRKEEGLKSKKNTKSLSQKKTILKLNAFSLKLYRFVVKLLSTTLRKNYQSF